MLWLVSAHEKGLPSISRVAVLRCSRYRVASAVYTKDVWPIPTVSFRTAFQAHRIRSDSTTDFIPSTVDVVLTLAAIRWTSVAPLAVW